MPSSAVYEAATRYRAALLARERRAATALVRYYGEAWARLSADIVALTSQVEGLRVEGLAEEALRGRIMRLERMQAIQSQVEAELRQYAALADQAVQDGKRWAVAAAEREAYELVQLSYPRGTVAATFYRMPREAAESLIGTLQDGTPLRKLIEQYVGDAAQALSERMVTGLVAGWNPRKLARELRKDFGMGLTDSLRLARTEQLRAYRTATLESYKANGDIVKGWRRLAAKDSRTCAACLFLDGKEYSTQEEMDDHPNGRCALVPITKTYAEMGIDAPEPQYQPESGREWFERQDEATQRKILGTGRYDAWKAGAFELEDIPHKTHDPVWGDSWTPRPLYDLLGESAPVGTYQGWLAGQAGTLVGFDGSIRFGNTGSATATATALHDGSIVFRRADFDELSDDTRRGIIAHEVAHQTVEEYVIHNNDEFDLAEKALYLEDHGWRKFFVGGHYDLGESISDSMPMVLYNDWPQALSEARRGVVSDWLKGAATRGGYSLDKLAQDIDRLLSELKSQR